MRQLKIGMPDDLRAILDDRANRAGHSLGMEVRNLLWAGLALKAGTEEYQREVAITNEAWARQ